MVCAGGLDGIIRSVIALCMCILVLPRRCLGNRLYFLCLIIMRLKGGQREGGRGEGEKDGCTM